MNKTNNNDNLDTDDSKLDELVESFNDEDIKKFELELLLQQEQEQEQAENIDSISQLPESSMYEKTDTDNYLDTAYDSMSRIEESSSANLDLNEKNSSGEELTSNPFDSILSDKNESSRLSELPSYSQLIDTNRRMSNGFDANDANQMPTKQTPALSRLIYNEGNNTSFEISNLDDLEENSLCDEDLSESVFNDMNNINDTTIVKSDETSEKPSIVKKTKSKKQKKRANAANIERIKNDDPIISQKTSRKFKKSPSPSLSSSLAKTQSVQDQEYSNSKNHDVTLTGSFVNMGKNDDIVKKKDLMELRNFAFLRFKPVIKKKKSKKPKQQSKKNDPKRSSTLFQSFSYSDNEAKVENEFSSVTNISLSLPPSALANETSSSSLESLKRPIEKFNHKIMSTYNEDDDDKEPSNKICTKSPPSTCSSSSACPLTENPEVISKKKPKKKTKKSSKTSTKTTTVNQKSSLNSTYTTNQIEKSIYKNEISFNLLANTLLETNFENDDLASFNKNKEDNTHLNADENADRHRKEAVVLVEKSKNSLAAYDNDDDEKSHIDKYSSAIERKQILKSPDMNIAKEEPFISENKFNQTESKSNTAENFKSFTQSQMTLNASPPPLSPSDVDKFSKIVESFIESKPLDLDYIGKVNLILLFVRYLYIYTHIVK
jgi:hypothetical protein